MQAPSRWGANVFAVVFALAWLLVTSTVRAQVPDVAHDTIDASVVAPDTLVDAAGDFGPDAPSAAVDSVAVDSVAVDSVAVDSVAVDSDVDASSAAVDSDVDASSAAVDSADALAVDANPDAVAEPAPASDSATPPHSAPHADPHSAHAATPTLSSAEAIRAIFGLVLLLALAYIGGHPAVQRLEVKLRISQVITAGFPFVLIGLISREGGLGILSDPVLDAIRPLLPLGLGWIGFAVGFRFDVRRIESMPPLAGETFLASTAIPYLVIVASTALFLAAVQDGEAIELVLRDAVVLATAGAMTAVALPRMLARQGATRADVDRVGGIILLEELAALTGILVIGAFFRPTGADGWQLPGVGWVFVTFGIGTALSGVVFALLGTIKGTIETLIIMLGSVCFTAGMASYLRLSPVVVCFIAGAVLQNFPGPWKDQVRNALGRVERPVYLMFLFIAGALWRVDEWQGWVLMLVFVAARLLGRIAGVTIFTRRHPRALSEFEQRHLAISPMGALSLAIIVTAQDLYSGPTVPWMFNAVLGGAILTEVIVQVFAFERQKPRSVTRSMPVFVIEHAQVDPGPPPQAPSDGHPPGDEP